MKRLLVLVLLSFSFLLCEEYEDESLDIDDGDVIGSGDINGGTFIVKLKSRRGSITMEKD